MLNANKKYEQIEKNDMLTPLLNALTLNPTQAKIVFKKENLIYNSKKKKKKAWVGLGFIDGGESYGYDK